MDGRGQSVKEQINDTSLDALNRALLAGPRHHCQPANQQGPGQSSYLTGLESNDQTLSTRKDMNNHMQSVCLSGAGGGG